MSVMGRLGAGFGDGVAGPVADQLSIRHHISLYLRHRTDQANIECRPRRHRTASFEIKMHGGAARVTVPAMPLTDHGATDKAADAMQAACFRSSLCDERAKLCSEIAERRDYIDRRHEHSRSNTARRLGSQLRSAESQLRYLDRLIARLDHRFGGQLSFRD